MYKYINNTLSTCNSLIIPKPNYILKNYQVLNKEWIGIYRILINFNLKRILFEIYICHFILFKFILNYKSILLWEREREIYNILLIHNIDLHLSVQEYKY